MRKTLWDGAETKYKFLADSEGDRVQLEQLYKACRGIAQVNIVGILNVVKSRAIELSLTQWDFLSGVRIL